MKYKLVLFFLKSENMWKSSFNVDTLQMPLIHISRLSLPSKHGVPSVTASRILSEKCSFSGRQCSSQGLTESVRREVQQTDDTKLEVIVSMATKHLNPVNLNQVESAHLC